MSSTGVFKIKQPEDACPLAKSSLFCAIGAAFLSPLPFSGSTLLALISPILCAASFILAMNSRFLMSDERYGKKGAGLAVVGVCLSSASMLIWLLIYHAARSGAH